MIGNSKSLILLPSFRKFIGASSSGRRLTPDGKRISRGTIRQYEIVYSLLDEYEASTTIPLRIKLIHRSPVKDLLKERTYWKNARMKIAMF